MDCGWDWPVCLLAASYERVLATAEEVLAGLLKESEHDGVFGGNAAAIYGLDRSPSRVPRGAVGAQRIGQAVGELMQIINELRERSSSPNL